MSLDRLLIAKDFVSPQEVDEALEYQRAYGGRLESHLFRLGYVSEEKLVAVLSELFGCAGICLTGATIDEDAISRLPAEFAWRWSVLPVAFDTARGCLTLASEDPQNPELVAALAAACPGTIFDIRISLGDILRSCLTRVYRRPAAGFDALESVETTSSAETTSAAIQTHYASTEPEAGGRCRVLLYDKDETNSPAIVQMLSHLHFAVSAVHSVEDLVVETRRIAAQALVLVVSGGAESALDLLTRLTADGLDVSECPTYAVLSEYQRGDESRLLQAGFEDAFGSDNVLDLLMVKLGRLRERLIIERAQRQEIMQNLGTHGSLTDMNVIDLLQAMGPTGKTARISVSAHGQQLTVFLDHGRIVYAECDDIRGPEAVYCALGWRQGVWSVDPVPAEELPEPNNELTNEAVLLDGCRRLDEMGRRSTASGNASSDPMAVFENLS